MMIDEQKMHELERMAPTAPSRPVNEIIVRGRRSRQRRLVARGGIAVFGVLLVGVFSVGVLADDNSEVNVASETSEALRRGDGGAFPRVLVEGWTVTQFHEGSGPMSNDPDKRYHKAETAFSRHGNELTLHQTEADRNEYEASVSDRGADSDSEPTVTVLGYPAEVKRYKGSQRHTAMWFADGVVYELDGDAGDAQAFPEALDGLRVVDDDEWEAALPERTITVAERGGEVDRMLRDLPEPPGFDPSRLRRGEHAEDRYQLGARVVRAVSCGWLERWWEARSSGDEGVTDEAVAAMATSRDWRVLIEMDAEGGSAAGVWDQADAMAAPEDSSVGRTMMDQLAQGNCPL